MNFLRMHIKWVRILRKFPYTNHWNVRFAYTKYEPRADTMLVLGKAGNKIYVLRKYRIPNSRHRNTTTLELLEDELRADADMTRRILKETCSDKELRQMDFQERQFRIQHGLPVKETPTFYVILDENNKALTYPGSTAVRTFPTREAAASKARTLPQGNRAVAVMREKIEHSAVEILFDGNFRRQGGFIVQTQPEAA